MSGRAFRIWLFVAIAILTAGGRSEAVAGPMSYSWSPLFGGGYYIDDMTNNETTFTTSNASLDITYDPDNPYSMEATLSSGSPGYTVVATYEITFLSHSAYDFAFIEYEANGPNVFVSLTGSGGPVNGAGYPLSLSGFEGGPVTAIGQGGYHDDFYFVVQTAVPEPSSLIPAATAVAVIAGWAVRRSGRRRAA